MVDKGQGPSQWSLTLPSHLTFTNTCIIAWSSSGRKAIIAPKLKPASFVDRPAERDCVGSVTVLQGELLKLDDDDDADDMEQDEEPTAAAAANGSEAAAADGDGSSLLTETVKPRAKLPPLMLNLSEK